MKPSIPQGTRDFGADVVKKRQYIFQTIQRTFELFGFQPLETPAFENIETLMGKYGEEGDKLIFKILNNGFDRPEKHEQAKIDFEKVLEGKSIKGITERALKYDLTIPFARYVAMNHAQLNMPFKRYQIQAVWRADRPQRGRYREFTQCDADVVGSKSLLNEVELISIYQNVPVIICFNNRKILAGLAELCGGINLLIPITVAIDKLDKIGIDKVNEELKTRGLNDDAISKINNYLALSIERKSNEDLLLQLSKMFEHSEIGMQGIDELKTVMSLSSNIEIDLTLARGLNYYTGTILEVKPTTVQMGSIGGGGRYDDLTSLFGVKDIAGVGISFGVDRIYDVMEELNLFPESISNSIDVMLVNFGAQFDKKNFEVLNLLRAKGISCELYPDSIKFDKQLKYANKRNASHIGMIGEDELKENIISIKNFITGEQRKMRLDEIEL
jgi:histidyl-tRNA synthetase